MKKIIFASALFLYSANTFALVFHTSCGDYVNVGTGNLSQAEVTELLMDINEINCGVRPSRIVYH